MVVYSFKPSTQEGRGKWKSVNQRPVWSTKRVPEQSGLHRETVSQQQQQQEKEEIRVYSIAQASLKLTKQPRLALRFLVIHLP